ncbi:hypothetical protein DBB36_00760 [Flavobacterium sp. WLB]|uniref:hypothetical protein n=1 Tax=Flavobacterium sp. WLB TaxID=2161662 RepID=UPI000D39BB70|nr:hypothetical protein [Flavobacterium sp. WLB]PUU71920.1 hypothetical protein DBB36_00760 [Flavobacterium sp. WLB]
MTKIILLFLAYLAFLSAAYSQSSEHLVFKGVPLDGTLSEYVSKMEQDGFTNQGTENGTAVLSGEFAGYKDCIVGVSTLKQKDLVYKIAVTFPKKDTWSALSGNYFDLKDMLAEKYGSASQVVEKFDSSSPPRDDSTRMFNVKFDNCKYFSLWKTDKGEIHLSIQHESVTRCYVLLSYSDKINSSIIKTKAKSDL